MKTEMKYNPWLSMWTKPRKTIREVVGIDPSYQLLLLCIIYGFPIMITISRFFSLGNLLATWATLIFSLLLSPIAGFIGISFWSILLYWAGKLVQGKNEYKNIRCAVAWSNVPNLVTCITWILLALVMGNNTFISDYFVTDPRMASYASALFGIQVVASIWSVVILIGSLAEVQKFSIWRAIGNILIPAVAVFLVCTLIKAIVI